MLLTLSHCLHSGEFREGLGQLISMKATLFLTDKRDNDALFLTPKTAIKERHIN